MHSNRGKPKLPWSSPNFRDRTSNGASSNGATSSSNGFNNEVRPVSTSNDDVAMTAPNSDINNDDAVRPPIQPRFERLVDGGQFTQMRLSSASQKRKANNGIAAVFESDYGESSSAKRPAIALAELFRPPVDLLFVGTFEYAKRYAMMNRRWLLIDIQKSDEFACAKLNRDVYRNEIVHELIRENLIFCQYDETSVEGGQFSAFYQVNSYPFVALVDPRTGELVYRVRTFDPSAFLEVLSEFLASRPAPFDGHLGDDSTAQKELSLMHQNGGTSSTTLDRRTTPNSDYSNDLQSTDNRPKELDSMLTSHRSAADNSMQQAYTEAELAHPMQPRNQFHQSVSTDSLQSGSTELFNDFRARISQCNSTAILSCIEAFSCLSFSPKTTPFSEDAASRSSHESLSDGSPFSAGNAESNASSECCAHSARSRISHLLVRLPDGSRTRIYVHAQRTIDEFLVHVSRCALTPDRFRFVTDFPRIDLSTAASRSLTFEQHHLVPSGTIYIEEM